MANTFFRTFECIQAYNRSNKLLLFAWLLLSISSKTDKPAIALYPCPITAALFAAIVPIDLITYLGA